MLEKTTCKNSKCATNFETFNVYNASMEDIERDYNLDLISALQMDLEYPRIISYVRQFGWNDLQLPDQIDERWVEDDNLCRRLYHALLCREIITAELECPGCGARHNIVDKVVVMM